MKTKEEIRLETFNMIQHMLTFSDPVDGHAALDVLAMIIQCGAETLAGACSINQAADGLRSVARYLETSPNLPNITFTGKKH